MRLESILNPVGCKGYREDLAYIHDTGFGWFAKSAGPQIIQILRARGIHSGLVVDLGCGSGILARALTDVGFDVLGIDRSPFMIELAQRRSQQAAFRVGNVLDTAIPRCRTVTAIGEILSYSFDPSKGPVSQLELFERVFAALEPGGLFIFDIAEPALAAGPSPQFRFWQGADWALLVETRKYPLEARIERHLTAFRRRGGNFRRSREMHPLELFRPSVVEFWLRKSGFRVQRRRAYGSFPLPPGRVAFLAAKPSRS